MNISLDLLEFLGKNLSRLVVTNWLITRRKKEIKIFRMCEDWKKVAHI